MADKQLSMEQLDAAMLYTSYPIKKILLSNYEGQITTSELADEYPETITSVTVVLDFDKKVKISLDLVKKDHVSDFKNFDAEEMTKIANITMFLRLCLDICTPLYTQRFELPETFSCDESNMTYYLDKDDDYRLTMILELVK